MLSKILSKKSCAKCKFCCSFKRTSLWEAPLFPIEVAKKLSKENEYGVISQFQEIFDNKNQCVAAKLSLENNYKTNDAKEEVLCPFLDSKTGCVLNEFDKPFDCSIWPLRVMKKNENWFIAFTPTCTSLGNKPSEAVMKLVQNDLGKIILEYAKNHPYIIKEYKDDFPIINLIEP